ncbi:MAG: hypothetical protein AB1405_17915, partial [Bdellovibrionota bacterium]
LFSLRKGWKSMSYFEKRLVFGVLLVAAASSVHACKRHGEEAAPERTNLKKIQNMIENRERGIQLEDLPEKYRKREQRDTKAGELFDIYVDGNFLRRVKAEEFFCEKPLMHQKGTKIKESCPFLPFLLAQTNKKIVQAELVGEMNDYNYHHFDLAGMEREEVELVAFVNRGGRLRVEERPIRSFLNEEEAAKGGKTLRKEGKGRGTGRNEGGSGEGTGGGTGKGQGQQGGGTRRGAMRGRFKTRGLLWADLYTSPVVPAEISATNAPEEAPPQTSKFSIEMPGGEIKWITTAAVKSCGEAGCDLGKALPEKFNGLWCVSAEAGTIEVSHEQLGRKRIKTHPHDGALLLEDPSGKESPIEAVTDIEPCSSPPEASPQ